MLLLTGLVALVLGVFGAIYFSTNRQELLPPLAAKKPPAVAAAQPVAPAPSIRPLPAVSTPHKRPQNQARTSAESAPKVTQASPKAAPPSRPMAAARSPGVSESTAGKLAEINPAAGPAARAPLAAISPPKATSPSQAAPRPVPPKTVVPSGRRYWVEFGAYDGPFYAERLKRNLAGLAIRAEITRAPGRHHRWYFRVRTVGDMDHDLARATFAKAERNLHIMPLIHRERHAVAAARIARTPPSGAHWVQFGAFHDRRWARRMRGKLDKNGLQASIIKRKYVSQPPLYLVRVSGLATRAEAVEIARRGTAALHSNDVLVGESLRLARLRARPPPR